MNEGIERSEASAARAEHAEWLARYPVPRSNFDSALLALINARPRNGRDGMRDGRRAAMVQALEGRATYGAIRMWRRGQRKPPTWAWETIQRKLTERIRHADHALALLRDS